MDRVLGALQGGFVAADSDGTIIHLNSVAAHLLGWHADALRGQPLEAIIPERMRPAHRQGFEHFNTTGESRLVGHTLPVPARGQDGDERDVELTVLAYEDGRGQRMIVAGVRPRGGPAVEVMNLEAVMQASDYRPLIQQP